METELSSSNLLHSFIPPNIILSMNYAVENLLFYDLDLQNKSDFYPGFTTRLYVPLLLVL